MSHYVAPVTGRIADRQQDRFARCTGELEGLRAPWVPIDGIVGMLQQVGAGFAGQSIAFVHRSLVESSVLTITHGLCRCRNRVESCFMLTYPEIDPIIFAIGPLAVRWYGLMYVIGFLAAWLLAARRAKQPWSVIAPEKVDDLIFYCMIGVIVGGRLGYSLFYGWRLWLDDPLYVFKITQGGMSFHGGLLGVMAAMWLYGKSLQRTMLEITDFVAPLVPIGLGAGRIGNFINGELWGKPTDLAIGFQVNGEVRHASQLYEAILEGLVLFVILWGFSSKRRPAMA